MGAVEIVGTVKIGRQTYKLKKAPLFVKEMGELFIESTVVQLRILAYATKDYIIDKILAQRPPTGRLRVYRLKEIPQEPPEPPEQLEKEIDFRVPRKFIEIPARQSDPATVERIPFKFEPLYEDWLKRKVKKGLDPRVLVATGDYLRGIVVRKRTDPNQGGVTYIVTMANRRHKLSNIRLKTLALIQEFGTQAYTIPLFGDKNRLVKISLPPRPHWRPAYRVLVDRFAQIGQEANARTVRLALQKLA